MDLRELIIKSFNSDEVKLFVKKEFKKSRKCSKLSKEIRNIGTQIFTQCTHDVKMHEVIWDSYLSSIAFTPTSESEELALSYKNLAEFLYHLKKYNNCIKTIDSALKITKSSSLKISLLCRKAKCLKTLFGIDDGEILEEAEIYLDQISNDKQVVKYRQLVRKTKDFLIENEKYDQKQLNINQTDNVVEYQNPIIAKPGVFDSVTVNFNKKYGKHLISTRDINPGEIIFVTKPYILVANFRKRQNFCHNCLTPLWSGVPCTNCTCMFCTENCFKEALEKYHDVECKVLSFVLSNTAYDYHIHASLRAVIMAVKELGSIEEVKRKVDGLMNSTVDNRESSSNHEFPDESFVNLFGFKRFTTDLEILDPLARICCKAAIALAKYSSFFGEIYNFDSIEKILENEDILYIGTLLLQVAAILHNNGTKIKESDVSCRNGIDQNACDSSPPCCERGYSLSTFRHLICHSCDPNVKTIKTESGRDLCYALKPIYEGYPLLECYGPTFFEKRLSDRFKTTERILGRNCICKACVNNWPALLVPNDEAMTYEDIFETVVESRETNSEKNKLISLVSKKGLAHQNSVNELSRVLTASYEYFNKPSIELSAAICLLNYAFEGLHGIKFNMPSRC